MGSRKRKTARPIKKSKSTDGRCPKCKTIVRFNVSGPVGSEIYECIGCTTKYKVDELWHLISASFIYPDMNNQR